MSLRDRIEKLKFAETGFAKFTDPTDPLYADYKDRDNEKWHDIGYNNAIDSVLRLIDDPSANY